MRARARTSTTVADEKTKDERLTHPNRAMTTRTQMNEAKVIAAGPGRRTMSGELVPLGAKRDARAR